MAVLYPNTYVVGIQGKMPASYTSNSQGIRSVYPDPLQSALQSMLIAGTLAKVWVPQGYEPFNFFSNDWWSQLKQYFPGAVGIVLSVERAQLRADAINPQGVCISGPAEGQVFDVSGKTPAGNTTNPPPQTNPNGNPPSPTVTPDYTPYGPATPTVPTWAWIAGGAALLLIVFSPQSR